MQLHNLAIPLTTLLALSSALPQNLPPPPTDLQNMPSLNSKDPKSAQGGTGGYMLDFFRNLANMKFDYIYDDPRKPKSSTPVPVPKANDNKKDSPKRMEGTNPMNIFNIMQKRDMETVDNEGQGNYVDDENAGDEVKEEDDEGQNLRERDGEKKDDHDDKEKGKSIHRYDHHNGGPRPGEPVNYDGTRGYKSDAKTYAG